MTDQASLIQLIETLAYNLYGMTLVGNPAPKVKEVGERMRNPIAGDLVMEQTTHGWADRDGSRLGKLLRKTREPVFTAEHWYGECGADPDEPIPMETVWYVWLPDGREFRWVNASFLAIPTGYIGYKSSFISDPAAVFPEVYKNSLNHSDAKE